jgi:GDPmannose 4,6-dehydratase
MTKNYREAYGIFACNGILFNHESERRGETFVTQKIALGAARIAQGMQKELVLGNLDSIRDWGYAPEYAEGMWRMLQHSTPDDYVLATNETHTVREFVELTFAHIGMPLRFEGEGEKEVGIDPTTGKVIVAVDPRYYRPTEVDLLIGNPAKAAAKLGWKPKTLFSDLVKMMAEADLKEIKGH